MTRMIEHAYIRINFTRRFPKNPHKTLFESYPRIIHVTMQSFSIKYLGLPNRSWIENLHADPLFIGNRSTLVQPHSWKSHISTNRYKILSLTRLLISSMIGRVILGSDPIPRWHPHFPRVTWVYTRQFILDATQETSETGVTHNPHPTVSWIAALCNFASFVLLSFRSFVYDWYIDGIM